MAGEISTIPRDVAIDREGDNIQKLIDWLETTLGTALLSSLNTTVKTSLVAAINELKAGLPATNIADPGSGGAIPVTASGVCSITTAGAETRTLAAPTFAGQRLGLAMNVDGGDCVITVAHAFNQDGDTTITLNDAGDYVELTSVLIASAFRWREVSDVERVDAAIEAAQTTANDAEAAIGDILTGMLTIPNASTSVVQAVGAGYNGRIAVVSFGEAPTAAIKVWAGPVSGGNLTINIDQDNTADLDVHFVLDGRAP